MIYTWLPALLLVLGSGSGESAGPANRWHTAGGGAARSGETRTTPIQAPVEIAWTHDAGGVIEGEPLVWDEWILITVRQGPDLRVLRALDLLDGKPLVVDHVVRSREPLEPSIWRDTVVFRAGSNILTALELSARRFEQVWTLRADGPVGPPLLVGSAVGVTIGGRLTRFTLGRSSPMWEREGQFRGGVALRDERFYAIDYDTSGRAFVATHDWASGAAGGRLYAGHHGGSVPALGDTPGVHLLSSGIFAHFDQPLTMIAEREVHVIGLSGAPGTAPTTLAPLPGTLALTAPPASWADAWIGPASDGEGVPTLVLKRDPLTRELRSLASANSNPDFVASAFSVTVAGSVAFVGARAFDLETSRVLWKLPLDATQRTVLARDTALVVDAERRLVAVRRAAGSGALTERTPLLERVEAGRLVLRDGSIERGTFRVDAGAGRVGRTDPAAAGSWPLSEVLLIEDSALRALLGRDVVRGTRVIVEHELGRAYLELANQARGANDLELLEDLVQQAWEHGVPGRELDAARRTLAILRQRPSTLRRSLSDQVRERRAQLSALPTKAFWARVQALDSDPTGRRRLAFLRATIEQDPLHEAATALVQSLLPAELKRGRTGVQHPLEWVDYLEATRRAPVRLVRAPASEGAAVTDSERALARAREEWRGDLIGFESEHLLILTSLDRPGVLARCLALGELVCQALESILPPGESTARQPRLVLHLFETRADYLEHSGPNSSEAGAGLEWAAGHYNRGTNISSIFVPASADAFRQVMKTYAHELTHHWLSARRVDTSSTALRAADAQPGYWIVEGFACLVDEFEFDLERGEWHTNAPFSRRQDLVANAGSNQLMPWDALYGISHAGFARTAFEGRPSIDSRCYLGIQQVVSGRHMFYAQAAATCRYLFEAPDSRLREALLAYVEAYYAGERAALELDARIGLTAAELGARTRSHARAALGMAPR